MTDNEIIKALECCTRGRKSNEDMPCLDCPYNECNIVGGTSERQITGTCQGWLMKDALALINSQEQRIGAQDITISELRQRCDKAEHDASRYKQRITELTKVNSMQGKVLLDSMRKNERIPMLEHEVKKLNIAVTDWKEIAEGYKKQFEDCAEDRAKLTEENKAWQMQLISQEEKANKAYYDIACEVENLRAENDNLHATCTELTQNLHECKADTVREMHSMLCEGRVSNDTIVIVATQIAKEMLEEE